MKKIDTQGITYIEPLEGGPKWYWGTDYASGDLYEAEELFQAGRPINQNKLLLVRYPDGRVIQPVTAQEGQYLGRPIFDKERIFFPLVDFPQGKITIMQFDCASERISPWAEIPLSSVTDCYNLMLKKSPLMLTRQGNDNQFQILWPEKAAFTVESTEAFLFRAGGKLYFSAWHEDPDYREETVVRKMETGEILERFPGSLLTMPDGQLWILE